jgi:energy-converting hydrogenase Eha subunit E
MASWSARSFGVKAVLGLAAWLLVIASGPAQGGEQMFKGQITRCMCAAPDLRAAASDKGEPIAVCSVSCEKKGVMYLLSDTANKVTYLLANQRQFKPFAGQFVVVMGTLDAASGTIRVDDIRRALPPKVFAAKSVAVVCDACPRMMAKARPAALEALLDWDRYTLITNPRKADLVFLVSANPYLGDFATRDGPDKRPVAVDITYVNVLDPRTGENLWGDSRQWGSMLAGKATRDLIDEFETQLKQESR